MTKNTQSPLYSSSPPPPSPLPLIMLLPLFLLLLPPPPLLLLFLLLHHHFHFLFFYSSPIHHVQKMRDERDPRYLQRIYSQIFISIICTLFLSHSLSLKSSSKRFPQNTCSTGPHCHVFLPCCCFIYFSFNVSIQYHTPQPTYVRFHTYVADAFKCLFALYRKNLPIIELQGSKKRPININKMHHQS